MTDDNDPHADLAAEMRDEVGTEIDRADQKASLLIGSLGIMFSIVLSAMIGGDWTLARLSPLGAALWVAGVVLASASVVSAALAVWPRMGAASDGAITYWGHVQGFASPADLAAAIAERGLHTPERTYQQLFVLAALAQRKYRWIRRSMVLAAVGFVALGLSFVLVA